jgi:lauroyl/myristoyl acyltransferase
MIIKDTFLRDMAKLVAWYPLRWIVTVSPWSLAYGAGKLVGTLDSITSKGRPRQMVENLLSVYGDKMTPEEAQAIARRIIQRHYVEHMEFYKFATLRQKDLPDHISFDGLENLDLELKKGKGVILAHMHFGSKQFPLVALGLMDRPVSQIGYRDSDAPDYSLIHKHVHLRIRTRIEDSFKMKHILLGNSLRPAYEALQNNEILMIAADGIGGIRGAGKNYLPIRFLGKTMMFPPGPARIARKTGSAILPLFCIEQATGKYKTVIGKPIDQQVTNDRDSDVRTNVERYVRIFEEYINRYPDHWMFWEEFREGHLVQVRTA